jgi:amino acid permease
LYNKNRRRIIMVKKVLVGVIVITFGFVGMLNAGNYGKKNIVDTAASAESFNTLVAAMV